MALVSSASMLVCVIHQALTGEGGEDAFISPITNAAIHAWYEAHIAAEDARRPALVAASEAMADIPEDACPMPPFPLPESIGAIVDETAQMFVPELVEAAVAYAASLAWKRGYEEGSRCSGCSYRGRGPSFARSLRDGRLRLELAFVDEHGERREYPGPWPEPSTSQAARSPKRRR